MKQSSQTSPCGELLAALAGATERVVELQTALTAARALPPENGGDGESEKAAWIEARLAAVGIADMRHVDAPDGRVSSGLRPNIVARIPGESTRTLWLFGHMDVVAAGDPAAWTGDPWLVRRDGDRLYGRGVEDNQQAIVCMLLLAEALKRTGIRPALSLGMVFMADEENGSRYGLAHILKTAPELFARDDIYIVPDFGSPDASIIEVAEKAQLWLRFETIGKQCHASTPEKGVNAMVAASHLVTALAEGLAESFTERDDIFSPPTCTFVPSRRELNVEGINILPGRDVFYVDCRLLPAVRQEDVLARVSEIAGRVERERGVRIKVTVAQSQKASFTDAASPDVGLLQDAVESEYGIRPRPVGVGGGTVAAHLREKGLPALVWARILNTCHQPDECGLISAAVGDSRVFARLIMNGSHA